MARIISRARVKRNYILNNIVKKKAENVKVFAPMSSGLDLDGWADRAKDMGVSGHRKVQPRNHL